MINLPPHQAIEGGLVCFRASHLHAIRLRHRRPCIVIIIIVESFVMLRRTAGRQVDFRNRDQATPSR